MNSPFHWLAALLAALLCAGCGARPQATLPTPDAAIVAAVPSPLPTAPPAATAATAPAPMPTAPITAPTTAPISEPSAPAITLSPALAMTPAAEASFTYLWPTYLPAGLAAAPAESRIARDGELGEGDIGFYIVTFNGVGQTLILSGGATEALPISGRITTVLVGGQEARLITNGDQRQLVLTGYQGALYLHGVGISEEELIRVAESLRPIDVRAMREQAGLE